MGKKDRQKGRQTQKVRKAIVDGRLLIYGVLTKGIRNSDCRCAVGLPHSRVAVISGGQLRHRSMSSTSIAKPSTINLKFCSTTREKPSRQTYNSLLNTTYPYNPQ